jgi:hypothetical protein
VSLNNIHEIKNLELSLTVYYAISNFGLWVKEVSDEIWKEELAFSCIVVPRYLPTECAEN